MTNLLNFHVIIYLIPWTFSDPNIEYRPSLYNDTEFQHAGIYKSLGLADAHLGRKIRRSQQRYQQKPPALPEQCERIAIDLCADMPYKHTFFPNLLNHQSQHEAQLEISNFRPLIQVQCAPEVHFFLCSLYLPICTDNNIELGPLPPCRSICESTRAGCEHLMVKFGFEWPKIFDCNNTKMFPVYGGPRVCVYKNESVAQHSQRVHQGFSQKDVSDSEIKGLPNDPKSGSSASSMVSMGVNSPNRNERQCPSNLRTRFSDFNLHFPISPSWPVKNRSRPLLPLTSYCGLPCDDYANSDSSADGLLFFSEVERKNLRYTVAAFSILAIVSSCFTFVTFLVDSNRRLSEYPERLIIFIALCSAIIGAVHLVDLASGNRIACSQHPSLAHAELQRQVNIVPEVKSQLATKKLLTTKNSAKAKRKTRESASDKQIIEPLLSLSEPMSRKHQRQDKGHLLSRQSRAFDPLSPRNQYGKIIDMEQFSSQQLAAWDKFINAQVRRSAAQKASEVYKDSLISGSWTLKTYQDLNGHETVGESHARENPPALIVPGVSSELCMVLGLVYYFFTIAQHVWWVLLMLSWFLTTALQWSSEAIGEHEKYFHAVAWILPSVLAVIALASRNVEGDPFLGICSVGVNNWYVDTPWVASLFVMVPLVLSLGLGLIFALLGTHSWFNIREYMRKSAQETDYYRQQRQAQRTQGPDHSSNQHQLMQQQQERQLQRQQQHHHHHHPKETQNHESHYVVLTSNTAVRQTECDYVAVNRNYTQNLPNILSNTTAQNEPAFFRPDSAANSVAQRHRQHRARRLYRTGNSVSSEQKAPLRPESSSNNPVSFKLAHQAKIPRFYEQYLEQQRLQKRRHLSHGSTGSRRTHDTVSPLPSPAPTSTAAPPQPANSINLSMGDPVCLTRPNSATSHAQIHYNPRNMVNYRNMACPTPIDCHPSEPYVASTIHTRPSSASPTPGYHRTARECVMTKSSTVCSQRPLSLSPKQRSNRLNVHDAPCIAWQDTVAKTCVVPNNANITYTGLQTCNRNLENHVTSPTSNNFNNTQTRYRQTGQHVIDKLNGLMCRLGLFSVVYVAATLIALWAGYRSTSMTFWLESWYTAAACTINSKWAGVGLNLGFYRTMCPLFDSLLPDDKKTALLKAVDAYLPGMGTHGSGGSTLPITDPHLHNLTQTKVELDLPHISIFYARYLSCLLVGICISGWIASVKTFHVWREYVCGNKGRSSSLTMLCVTCCSQTKTIDEPVNSLPQISPQRPTEIPVQNHAAQGRMVRPPLTVGPRFSPVSASEDGDDEA